jgi:hypothetical protein
MLRNIRRKAVATVFLTLALCGTALAVWYLQGAIEGTSAPTKIAKTTTATVVPIKVAFAAGALEPGGKEPLELTIENTSPGATEVNFHNIALTVASSNEAGCPKSDIKITTTNGFWKEVIEGKQATMTHVAPGASLNVESVAAGLTIELVPAASQACETATFTVHAVAS